MDVSLFTSKFMFDCPKEDTLVNVLEQIKSGIYKVQIDKAHNTIKENNFKKNKKYDQLKKTLNSFTPSATFGEERKEKYIKGYNKIIVLDIDYLKDFDETEKILEKAKALDTTYCGFVSPSGIGCKILVKVNSEAKYHTTAFKLVKRLYEIHLQKEIDPTGSDVSRLCYFSYDPSLIIKENSRSVNVMGEINEKKILKVISSVKKTTQFKEGSRHNFIFKVSAYANKLGVSLTSLSQFLGNTYSYQDFDKNEITKIVKNTYSSYEKQHYIWKNDLIPKKKTLNEELISEVEQRIGIADQKLNEGQFIKYMLKQLEEEETNTYSMVLEYKDLLSNFEVWGTSEMKEAISLFTTNSDKDELLKVAFIQKKNKSSEISDSIRDIGIKVLLLKFILQKVRNKYEKTVFNHSFSKLDEVNEMNVLLTELQNIHNQISDEIVGFYQLVLRDIAKAVL